MIASVFPVVLGFVALVTGAVVLETGGQLEMLFVLAAVGVLAVLAVRAVRSGDLLSPLGLVVGSAAVRFGLPALLLQFDEPPVAYSWLTLSPGDWERGALLALLGVTAVALGWMWRPAPLSAVTGLAARWLARNVVVDGPVALAALGALFAGSALMGVFMALNYASPLQAVIEGLVRSQELRTPGTSRYAAAGGSLLSAGCAVLTVWLAARGLHWWWVLTPALYVLVAMTPFGGRVVAMTPLCYALMFLWYRRGSRPLRLRTLLPRSAVLVVTGLAYMTFVIYYRGGGGIGAGVGAVSGRDAFDYLTFFIWYELGMLHPFALATYFGPGVLEGRSFQTIAGYAAPLLFTGDGIRPGEFMIAQLIGVGGWGFHTGLVVDLYMNTDVIFTVGGCVVFGALLRLLYDARQAAPRSPAVAVVYAVMILHAFWVFYESVAGALNVFLLVMPFLAAITCLGTVLRLHRAGRRGGWLLPGSESVSTTATTTSRSAGVTGPTRW